MGAQLAGHVEDVSQGWTNTSQVRAIELALVVLATTDTQGLCMSQCMDVCISSHSYHMHTH